MNATSDVPKEYVRNADHHLLPPRVGHNWNDQAFRKKQGKPQQLEMEFRGKRAFTSVGNYDNPMPENMGLSAQQLLLALSAKNRGNSIKGAKNYATLNDKVLRFYAFFREPAPEGGANDFWHRRVVICFFPEDDTILIQEPQIPNSGMDGGTFLKRQKVRADPRQREQFPNSEYLTLNFFNVGQSVRINSVDFFLYDCDAFTRDLLTTLGVVVGEPMECPDDEFLEAYKSHQQKLASGKFGVTSTDYHGDEAERAARFRRDGGKKLSFSALLDERKLVPGGIARKMEVQMYLEDETIAILEHQSTDEAVPGLFLSRCFLPKCGSMSKLNELTFAHRVNGQREPSMGSPDAFYKEKDLDVGNTINVLGRKLLLYNCDDYTRDVYRERYGITLRPALDVSSCFDSQRREKVLSAHRTRPADTDSRHVSSTRFATIPGKPKDTLRFMMLLANPKNSNERFRRFTLTYYTDTNEMEAHEAKARNSGYVGGCIMKRQPLRKPIAPRGPRNDPLEKTRNDEQYYGEDDIRIGNQIVVQGMLMNITAMDAHTAAYLNGTEALPTSEAQVDLLLSELLEYLGSRYGTAVKAFLAFDHDRDGIIGLPEFISSLKSFQITEDPALAEKLFLRIAGSAFSHFYLTTDDIMKWMSGIKQCEKTTTESTFSKEDQAVWITARAVRMRALHELRERLEARCFDSVQMFRLASRMPRAYRGLRADIHSLTNPDRDAHITPVQLRRCIKEILGGRPTEEEMASLLSFFFPDMPKEEFFRTRDHALDYTVDLPTFQRIYNDLGKLTMLPPGRDEPISTAVKTSVT